MCKSERLPAEPPFIDSVQIAFSNSITSVLPIIHGFTMPVDVVERVYKLTSDVMIAVEERWFIELMSVIIIAFIVNKCRG